MAWTDPKTMGHEPTLYTDWNTYIRDNLNHLKNDVGAKRATMWADEFTVVVGNPILMSHQPDQNYCMLSRQNTPANGDTLTCSFVALAGTYTLSILCAKTSISGKIDIYIDNVVVVTALDLYNETSIYNALVSNSVTVTGNGYHILKIVVNGKNASSTNYTADLTKLWLKPSSD